MRDIATSGAFLVQSGFSAFRKGLHTCTESISSGVGWSIVTSRVSQFTHFGSWKAAPISPAFAAWIPTPELVLYSQWGETGT